MRRRRRKPGIRRRPLATGRLDATRRATPRAHGVAVLRPGARSARRLPAGRAVAEPAQHASVAPSQGVDSKLAWPTMWATSWRTSHSVQSVGRLQSSGRSASTASVTRWYSVWASRIAVGRSIDAWTTSGPGQVATQATASSESENGGGHWRQRRSGFVQVAGESSRSTLTAFRARLWTCYRRSSDRQSGSVQTQPTARNCL
jgi:hypothetical protein